MNIEYGARARQLAHQEIGETMSDYQFQGIQRDARDVYLLANGLARRLQEDLTADQIDQVRVRNSTAAYAGNSSCASHDFVWRSISPIRSPPSLLRTREQRSRSARTLTRSHAR